MDLLDGKGNRQQQCERVKALRHKIGPRPRWMHSHRGGDASWYTAPSDSALARLAVYPLGETKLTLRGGRLRPDPLLRLELHRSMSLDEAELLRLKNKWQRLHKVYLRRHSALRRQHEEEKLARERRAQQEGGRGSGAADGGAAGDEHENEWRDRYYQLVAEMRERNLLAAYAAEREANALAEPPRLLAEACALYEAVYEEAHRATRGMDDPHYYTAFVWHMAGDLLLFVRKARLSRASDASRALFSNAF